MIKILRMIKYIKKAIKTRKDLKSPIRVLENYMILFNFINYKIKYLIINPILYNINII